MDDEPDAPAQPMDVDEPEEKQVEPEHTAIDPMVLLDVLQDPNEDAFVAMFDEYGVDFDDMVSNLLGIADVSDLDKDELLTQKLTLIKQLLIAKDEARRTYKNVRYA